MAFPVEEGLKLLKAVKEATTKAVFMAFPVEEGLKPNGAVTVGRLSGSFYGLSSRRRIET